MNCTRRMFFSRLSQTLASDVLEAAGAIRTEWARWLVPGQKSVGVRRWLRPPGAIQETAFLATCTRCTNCQQACPFQSIRRLGPESGFSAGTPVIIPDDSPCYLCEDMPCIKVCEPRALVFTERENVRMGLAKIDDVACYAAQGQPCDYCVAKCPIGRDAIRFSESGNPIVAASACTGCGVCAFLCPARAVSIVPREYSVSPGSKTITV